MMCAETNPSDTEAHTAAAEQYGVTAGPGGAKGIDFSKYLDCAGRAAGFCAASVDGYCIDGTDEGKCHG